jgi:hypothetical protein
MASSSIALQRVNLNLPSEARHRLKSLARAARRPEGVYARELFLAALEREEAAELRRRLEATRTPERRARDRAIAAGLERLRG